MKIRVEYNNGRVGNFTGSCVIYDARIEITHRVDDDHIEYFTIPFSSIVDIKVVN